jgi:hypothetical protein
MSGQDDRPKLSTIRQHALPHEEMVEAALEGAAPSRAAVWAWFAAGAIALEKGGYPVGAPSAAGLADDMLAEYDKRFPGGWGSA